MVAIHEPDAAYILGDRPAVERHANVFATPFQRVEGTIRGALYRQDGTLIEASQRVSGIAGDRIQLSDATLGLPDAGAARVEGSTCYLGHVMNHYGHLITEGLSAAWMPEGGAQAFDAYALHPFIFGSGMRRYVEQAFERVGIDVGKVILIDRPMVFADITVPTRAWLANKGAYSVCNEVVDRIRAPHTGRRAELSLYLSRREVANRAVGNESEIEALFQRAGFVVLHPELLAWPHQLDLFAQARVIAGFGGSALHNVLFCPPGAATIVLGDMRAPKIVIPNQRICAALRGSRTALIPFAGDAQAFDLGHLRKELPAALEALR